MFAGIAVPYPEFDLCASQVERGPINLQQAASTCVLIGYR